MDPKDVNRIVHALDRIAGKSPVFKISGATLGATSATYTSGYVVGGLVTLKSFARNLNGSGIIQSVVIQDLSKQSLAIDVIFFDSNPTASTFTNNAVCDIADADITKVIGIVNVLAGDYAAFNDNSAACVKGLALPYSLTGDSGSIYVLFVTRGAPTYVANELSAAIGILQDA